MNARAVAAWTGACIFVSLFTTNPVYKALVLVAAFLALATSVGLARMRRLLIGVAFVATFDALLNFVSAHVGRSVLFALPDSVPGVGGQYTLEALAFGAVGGITVAVAILAAAPFSLLLAPHDVIDALPRALSRTGTTVAASMNLVPSIATSFAEVSEAQRFRGWRPRGPGSWAEVVVPVVLTSAERSIQLAESMEARGFAANARTTFLRPSLRRADWLLFGASGGAAALFPLAHAMGWAADWFAYPTLSTPQLDLAGLFACALLFAPVLTWRSRD